MWLELVWKIFPVSCLLEINRTAHLELTVVLPGHSSPVACQSASLFPLGRRSSGHFASPGNRRRDDDTHCEN